VSEVLTAPPGKAGIDALLERHERSDVAAAVAFFSLESPKSFIAARDADGTITPLIGFWPLPVRGGELLDAIAGIDETGERLIVNYQETFLELTETIRSFGAELEPFESESLGWLLAACSLTLGMTEDDVARALGPLPSLVKVDTEVVEHEERYVLDSRRLLRSVMSYRIADVPSHVLARSVFEALGDYAANAVRRLLRDWKVDLVVCAGDLFARNQFIAERTRRGLVRPNVQVLFPAAAEEA
jgi:hydrogenase maturation protein HypF